MALGPSFKIRNIFQSKNHLRITLLTWPETFFETQLILVTKTVGWVWARPPKSLWKVSLGSFTILERHWWTKFWDASIRYSTHSAIRTSVRPDLGSWVQGPTAQNFLIIKPAGLGQFTRHWSSGSSSSLARLAKLSSLLRSTGSDQTVRDKRRGSRLLFRQRLAQGWEAWDNYCFDYNFLLSISECRNKNL